MQLASVIGHATSTVKHHSMNGWRLLVVQPLLTDRGRDGTPILAIDELGSQVGQDVMICSDGKTIGDAMGTQTSPVRWIVIGQPDD
ncbi:EutN/CcmL family microcompartment protein [Thalassoglobus polymorphus]|uniref:Ethanolamine utilization protein EutN n=1 Tax=Thalassoglobus polymorphus TaxID=2527994 RepID=A0A517QHA8_9PLAN|nr:EutN/CcmL family microcompartment protein [Thalassoglobus polymorphus]QDT30995.1 Ethanolamine utilization protein EutN [Thalassoglobus polymorphus]